MNDHIVVQYLGFDAKEASRDYTFVVRTEDRQPLEYTLTIANEAFVSHLVRYQDAPEICSLRLHRELDTHSNHPPATLFCITETELANYQCARTLKPKRSFYKRDKDDPTL